MRSSLTKRRFPRVRSSSDAEPSSPVCLARTGLFLYNEATMDVRTTVLIIPPNDAEAILIAELAEKIGLPTIRSKQLHGASLDKGKQDFVREVKEGGYQTVVVVEMPGLNTEAKLQKLGVDLVLIDHHNYTDLDRVHDPKTGKILPSSIEQFLKRFKINDIKLKQLGYDPHIVRGIGVMDRGYVWALQDEGYSKKELKLVLDFHDKLLSVITNSATEERKEQAAYNAWLRRESWRQFFVIESSANVQLRPLISRIVALEIGKPTPLIVVERARQLIYVQESDYANRLIKQFGGFTFGLDRNWGYHNEEGKQRVTLKDVKQAIIRLDAEAKS